MMTNELQMALLAFGGLVVAGIFAYGKWQERKRRKRAEQLFKPPEADVLLDGKPWMESASGEPAVHGHSFRKGGKAREKEKPAERCEPTLGDPEMEEMPEPAWEDELESLPEEDFPEPASFDTGESLASFQETPATGSAERSGPALPYNLLSSGIDAIIAFDLVEPVRGERVMASQQEILQQIEKPVLWVGLNEEEGVWERARKNGSYRCWQVGLQLADRSGPVGGNEFLLFARAMQRLTGELMTVVKNMPASQQVLEQAQQLDRFCVDMDIQIGINLVSRGVPFPGTKIRALAESAGMVLGTNGCYVRRDEEGRTLFALSNVESERGFVAETIKTMNTRALVFLLDVPRTPQGKQVFKQMLTTARGFARTLNGALEDDNGRPLSEEQLYHISEEYVAQTQSTLEAAGLSAGGPLALRLFS